MVWVIFFRERSNINTGQKVRKKKNISDGGEEKNVQGLEFFKR